MDTGEAVKGVLDLAGKALDMKKAPAEATPVKAGVKSSEFWLSALVIICGLVLASGVLVEGSATHAIVGGVVTILAALGYTKGRTAVKVEAEITAREGQGIARALLDVVGAAKGDSEDPPAKG